MNVLFILAFILSSILTNGQISAGIYCAKNYDSEYFNIREDNKFDYIYSTCTGEVFGSGNFNFKMDTLYFNFEECISCPKRLHDVRKIRSDSDSIYVNIKLVDELGGIPGANCTVKGYKKGFQSKGNGEFRFRLPKTDHSQTLEFSFIGMASHTLEIESGVSEVIATIELMRSQFLAPPKILKFYVTGFSKYEIKTIRENEPIVFKKIKAKSFLEQFKDYKDQNNMNLFLSNW